jgi:hypothetical protein
MLVKACTSAWPNWEVVELVGGLYITAGMFLKGIVEPQPLHSLLFPGSEVSTFSVSHAPTMKCCLTTGPKQ